MNSVQKTAVLHNSKYLIKASRLTLSNVICRKCFATTSSSSNTGSSNVTEKAIDCHTHMYTPKYIEILRKRNKIPRIISGNTSFNNNNGNNDATQRLLILPEEDNESSTSNGRRIGPEYYDINYKLNFMKTHKINQSIISLANPWLDFLEENEAAEIGKDLNDELNDICESSYGKLYGLASLPIKSSTSATILEIERLKSLSHIKGLILGTSGKGKGLDDENMRDILAAIEKSGLTIFLHPHYGVGNEHYHGTGHALFLALGFPFETTVSVSRLIVTGTIDRFPKLKILIAHAGAALPSLIGRLDSCVMHDTLLANQLLKKPSEYLKDFYFDAISYGTPQLQSLFTQVGEDRIVFGTDHPFFPPPSTDNNDGLNQDFSQQVWPSALSVHETIDGLKNVHIQNKILYGNAQRLFSI